MLLVIIPIIEKEISSYCVRLTSSCENFIEKFGADVCFLLIIQSDGNVELPLSLTSLPGMHIHRTNLLSVSAARNFGIDYAIKNNARHVVFHDSSLFYPEVVCEFFFSHRNEPLVKACYNFSNVDVSIDSEVIRYRKPNKITDYYVWLYMFEVSGIKTRFDQNFGPGKFTRFKSGEDFLFLANYFESNGRPLLPELLRPHIEHPPRPDDYSKHLTYALGQGKLFQILILKHFEFKYLIWCCLFFGNAFFRVLMFKPNAFYILKDRVKGFFDF